MSNPRSSSDVNTRPGASGEQQLAKEARQQQRCSIIIPVLNEEENMPRLLKRLQDHGGDFVGEILVIDGGSKDQTVKIAQESGAEVQRAPEQGRAQQMNFGASLARHDILYFVHGDTLPPIAFSKQIQQSLEDGYPLGCFQYDFDSDRFLLKINAYFTRFDRRWCRGGDQSLYIRKKDFEKLGGFRSDYKIMEDFEFIERARKTHPFRIMPDKMIVSARKYETNSYLRVQLANLVVFNMYRLGASQEALVRTYKRMLDYR